MPIEKCIYKWKQDVNQCFAEFDDAVEREKCLTLKVNPFITCLKQAGVDVKKAWDQSEPKGAFPPFKNDLLWWVMMFLAGE